MGDDVWRLTGSYEVTVATSWGVLMKSRYFWALLAVVIAVGAVVVLTEPSLANYPWLDDW